MNKILLKTIHMHLTPKKHISLQNYIYYPLQNKKNDNNKYLSTTLSEADHTN